MAAKLAVLLFLASACGGGNANFYQPTAPDACAQSCAGRCGQSPRSRDPKQCACDGFCRAFGDCCEDVSICDLAEVDSALANLTVLFECRSVHFDERTLPKGGGSFWMVSACPVNWLGGREDQLLLDIVNNCSRDSANLPPVTDIDTGVVYKNEYCAICHEAARFQLWSYTFQCGRNFQPTPEDVNEMCVTCGFTQSRLGPGTMPARQCVHHSRVGGIPSCLTRGELQKLTGIPLEEDVYHEIVNQCQKGPIAASIFEQNSVEESGEAVERVGTFKNRYCALCNGFSVLDSLQTCVNPFSPSTDYCISEARDKLVDDCEGGNGTSCTDIMPFSVLMDVRGDTQFVMIERHRTSVPTPCSSGQVFDPISQSCRKTLCPESIRRGSCSILQNITLLLLLPPPDPTPAFAPDIAMDVTLNINITDNVTGNDSVSISPPLPPSLFCDGELILLGPSEFTPLVNNTIALYGDQHFEIIGYINSSVVICTNFSQNGTIVVNTTVYLYSYPEAFSILTWIGGSMSIAGCAFVLLTYSLFKELRTLPGKILMNLSTAIMATSVFLLFGIPLFALSEKEELCQTTAIFLHWLVLSEFSWMTVMSYELARTMFRGSWLRKSENEKAQWHIFLLYLLIGWGLPTLITLLTVIINFTTELIDYGENGFCWINNTNAFYVLMLVPVIITILVNSATFGVTSYLLFKAQRGEAKLQKKKSTSYLRIYLSVFSITGLTWVFGFVAILAREDWAWYLFIILNSSQGFIICLAFLFTQKIFSYYKMLFWPKLYALMGTSQSSRKEKTVSTELAVRSNTNSASINTPTDDSHKSLATTKSV